jgi:hypothetical protein
MPTLAKRRAQGFRSAVTRQRQLLEREGVPQADLTATLVDTLRTLIGMATASR